MILDAKHERFHVRLINETGVAAPPEAVAAGESRLISL
jgi:hypothetical protein